MSGARERMSALEEFERKLDALLDRLQLDDRARDRAAMSLAAEPELFVGLGHAALRAIVETGGRSK